MGILGMILLVIAGLASLGCLIVVLVKMFQAGQTGLGIAVIVLTFCTGIGPLIAFIYGWVKSGEWGIKNVMLIWTLTIVVSIVGYVMAMGEIMAMMGQQQQQLQQQMPQPGR